MAVTFAVSIRRDLLKKGTWEQALGLAADHVGFCGADEGTLLAEEAHELGFETESWVLDSGQAPHERDWLAQLEEKRPAVLFFESLNDAHELRARLLQFLPGGSVTDPVEVPDEDWDAAWRRSFTGIDVGNHFKIRPPWSEEAGNSGVLIINPGAGFGTGTHETTQLCLEEIAKASSLRGKRVLDFGSGSGILGIGCTSLGAQVTCVEIDPLANENAMQNAALNQQTLTLRTELDPAWDAVFDVVLANILRPILIEYGADLWRAASSGALFIYSGLVEEDLDRVIESVRTLGLVLPPQVTKKGDWRALSFRKP